MNRLQGNRISIVALAIASCSAVVLISHAQTTAQPGRGATAGAGGAASKAQMDAEREQIWNSPNMLRARAWLQDYCSKSAKVTPEMAKQYQQELANMTPNQLRLWLAKFDHEEEQRQQQYAFWQQAHAAQVQHAQSVNRATQQAYAAMNKAQSESAELEQQQIDVQREEAQAAAETKQLDTMGPYPNYWSYPGYGGLHYHYHMYPYPY